jgi:2-oxoglutarate/2-oxoacid ferredoxin oxidoreductase subunit alpha
MTTRVETSPRVLTGKHFMNGDVACAEGAVAAGCNFFAGYPITPSTEIAERLSRRLPEVGATYIQMEDELASMAAILGAAWGGARSMTATSGPGFTLMLENIGLGVMTETPCVVVDVQRGSPSTGLPTLVGQSDVMQARWGSHGDYEIVAYSPSSCQEMFDLTVKAFNTADLLRIPVILLADEAVGHMTERVVIPEAAEIPVLARRRPTTEAGNGFRLYAAAEDLVPAMPDLGAGYHVHVTGLTHDERGYPSVEPDVHDRLVRRLNDKVKRRADELVECERFMLDDADVVVVAYGSLARSARQAVREAREAGLRAGLLRPITLWPFPERAIRELDSEGRTFIVAELNLGQVATQVERFTTRTVHRVNHAGGLLMPPAPIRGAIREVIG